MRRLEEGDLKLRVRALDSERALTRVLVRLSACVPQEHACTHSLGVSYACITDTDKQGARGRVCVLC